MTERYVSGKSRRRQEIKNRKEQRNQSTWEELAGHDRDMNDMLVMVEEQVSIFEKAQADGLIRADDQHYNEHLAGLRQSISESRDALARLRDSSNGRTGTIQMDDMQDYLTIMNDYQDLFLHHVDRVMPIGEHLTNYVYKAEREKIRAEQMAQVHAAKMKIQKESAENEQ